MARLLYGACPTAVIISVDGEDFGYGTNLSPVVRAAVPEVIQRVRDVLVDGVGAVCAPVAAGPGLCLIGG